MRLAIFTKGSHPHTIVELRCDIDRLVQCIKDEETDPAEVIQSLSKGIELIKLALHKGMAKRDEA
jgi:hypothetical protein